MRTEDSAKQADLETACRDFRPITGHYHLKLFTEDGQLVSSLK